LPGWSADCKPNSQSMALRLLAFAAASGRVATVFLVGNQLMDWQISDQASKSIDRAVAWVGRQVAELRPHVIVTEDLAEPCPKGARACEITEAVSELTEALELLNPRVRRHHDYANKYEEADAIAAFYPELKPWLPDWRRFFENEPRNTVLFEAMSYALFILQDPPKRLGAAMG
jgi:hypothetical protein